ncbi:MAG: single-stranded DNA-binding protein [Acidimicrobiia bacterium]
MNRITIAGRVDEEPVRKEANGRVVYTFRFASGRSGSKAGRLWIEIERPGPYRRCCYRHLRKGRTVIVAGRLAHKQWADAATGERRSRFVVSANEVDFLLRAAPDPQTSTTDITSSP